VLLVLAYNTGNIYLPADISRSKNKPTTRRKLWQRRRQTSNTRAGQEINWISSEAEQAIKSIPKTVMHLEGNKVLEGTNDIHELTSEF
jgi:hypothetical protein